jgi:hypothetical protein
MKCDLDNCNLVDDLVRDDLSSSKPAKIFIRAFSADPVEAILDACESLSCPCVSSSTVTHPRESCELRYEYRTRKLKTQNTVTCHDDDMTVAEGKSKEYNLRNIPQEKQAASRV